MTTPRQLILDGNLITWGGAWVAAHWSLDLFNDILTTVLTLILIGVAIQRWRITRRYHKRRDDEKESDS